MQRDKRTSQRLKRKLLSSSLKFNQGALVTGKACVSTAGGKHVRAEGEKPPVSIKHSQRATMFSFYTKSLLAPLHWRKKPVSLQARVREASDPRYTPSSS